MHRTPDALESLGSAYLVMGDAHRAVLVLEEATDIARPSARLLGDLAAAYLARATRNNQPQDFAKAVTMADRAVKTDGRAAEGWFNRAWALERLSLFNEARQAWQDYLNVDGTSGWAGEARNRLRALEKSPRSTSPGEEQRAFVLALSASTNSGDLAAVIKDSPEAAQRWLDNQMLVEWPRLVLSGHPEDARAVTAGAQRVADALARERDDAFWRDVVGVVVKASSHGSADELARGQRHFAAADAYEADRVGESTRLIAPAIGPLDRAASPLAIAARRFRAIGAYYANDFPAALEEIRGVQVSARRRHYTRMLGLGYRLEGLVYLTKGDFARALDAYAQALTCFQAMGGAEDEAAIQTSLAEEFEYVGDMQRSWQARYAALSLIISVHDPLAVYRMCRVRHQPRSERIFRRSPFIFSRLHSRARSAPAARQLWSPVTSRARPSTNVSVSQHAPKLIWTPRRESSRPFAIRSSCRGLKRACSSRGERCWPSIALPKRSPTSTKRSRITSERAPVR